MLESLEGKRVTTLPHLKDYNTWRNRLSDADYEAIEDDLNRRIDAGDIHTAGWMPGSDWTDTVFEPIYHTACRKKHYACSYVFRFNCIQSIYGSTGKMDFWQI